MIEMIFCPPHTILYIWLQKYIIEKDIHCEQISLKYNTNCLYKEEHTRPMFVSKGK